MVVEQIGEGPRVVLVHGSVTGPTSWRRQRALADAFRLELVARPGFLPGPPAARVDFEEDAPLVAELLGPGAHLVGHSYGGVVSLLAAALRPEAVRSLVVVEPPALAVARGVPAVEAFVAAAQRHWREAPREPRTFAEGFLRVVGSARTLPEPLPPELERGAKLLMVERPPWEAEVPFAALRDAGFPVLVVSGGHSAAFDAVCDVLERELGAERAVHAGAGHGVMAAPGFNETLRDFLERASR